ncbi:MAG: hypothetical protein L0Y72_13230 [Gemmataceae bacterium]|nr:hypothetical protein [Gemmataceae bacterium]MCI0740001.1 hypothetical protein [Gemmataceae bacterium]
MSLLPPRSRCQLEWKQFFQDQDGNWLLHLQPYYAELFANYFPTLMKQSPAGFRDFKSARNKFALFSKLPARDVQRIQGFLKFFERAVCLGINKHLKNNFTDELDFCLALDFNKPSPQADRTEIGELEYQAKYQQNSEALSELAKELAFAIEALPRCAIPQPRLLTHVPSRRGLTFCLPSALCRAIVSFVKDSFWGDPRPVALPSLSVAKQSAKNLTVDQKLDQWKSIVASNGIRMSRPVEDCSIIVIDDLYQSGASMWTFASFLKNRKVRSVVGLACVKSLRDTDNR